MKDLVVSILARIASGKKIRNPIDVRPSSKMWTGKKDPSSWGKSRMKRGHNQTQANARRRRQIERGILRESNGLMRVGKGS